MDELQIHGFKNGQNLIVDFRRVEYDLRAPTRPQRPSADGGAPIVRPVLFAAADYRLVVAKFLAKVVSGSE